MKKILSISLIGVLLITSLFILTGCNKEENNNVNPTEIVNTQEKGVTLKLDFQHMNNTVYTAKFNLSSDQEVLEFNEEDDPTTVGIGNSKENYYFDLTLDENAKTACEEFKKSAKQYDNLKDVKFGKYDGYYYNIGDEIIAYVFLDTSDNDAYIYVMADLYYDENKDDSTKDINTIFQSSEIQNIVNNITFNATKSGNRVD